MNSIYVFIYKLSDYHFKILFIINYQIVTCKIFEKIFKLEGGEMLYPLLSLYYILAKIINSNFKIYFKL
jgi:hypothetical protein